MNTISPNKTVQTKSSKSNSNFVLENRKTITKNKIHLCGRQESEQIKNTKKPPENRFCFPVYVLFMFGKHCTLGNKTNKQ